MDYGQDTLFGKKIISSINYDEQDLLKDIFYLHANGKRIDVDPCYSVGNFYKNGLPEPVHKFDKTPQAPGVIEATSDNLPLPDASCEVVMFDPPFVIGGQTYMENAEGSSIIAKRFTNFKDFDSLKQMYSGSLKEFARILMGGVLLFSNAKIVWRVGRTISLIAG